MEEVEKVIDNLKVQLYADKSQSRARTISYLLEVLRATEGEMLVMRLVYNGIISDLIQNVSLLSRRDFLECLQIIVKANAFYIHGLVNKTIEGITKYEFKHSIQEATLALNILLSIVTKVFLDFTESQGIELIERHEESLLNFIERSYFDSSSILSATKLLTFLLRYSSNNFKYSYISNINAIYDKMMAFSLTREDISDLEKLKIICCTSLSVTNFCNKLNEKELYDRLSGSSGASSIAEIPEIKTKFTESIKRVTFEFLLPFRKSMDLDFDTTKFMIEFLIALINLQDLKDERLCVEMLHQGYLKYLLELSVLHSKIKHFRKRICYLISDIIVVLKDSLGLNVDDWQGGINAFQTFLCNGFESLPSDFEQWENLLKGHTMQANSLMILLYCHYIGTNEIYIVTQKALTVKLTSVVEHYTEPIFLKSIWLLLSATALVSQVPISNYRSYSKAVKSLASCLQSREKMELAYTHNADLFFYAIKEIDFPETLRIKTISLWLDNAKTSEECDIFIQECLIQHYDELKIIELIMDVIHKTHMKTPNNALDAYDSLLKYKKVLPDEVKEFIWKTVSDDLSHCTPNNYEILKTVLRITATLKTSTSISNKIIRKCATEICKVLLRDGRADVELKILLTTVATCIIKQSVDNKDQRVAEIYLKNDVFLREIHANGFSLEEKALTEMSLRMLSCLMISQNLYGIQSTTISQMTFYELKYFLPKLRAKGCSPVFGIEFVKFILKNTCDKPVIRLKANDLGNDLEDIYHIYLFIHILYTEIESENKGQIFQCLSTILYYCYRKKLNFTKFFMCPMTSFLMESAASEFAQTQSMNRNHFLNFSITWLEYLEFFVSKEENQNFKYHKRSLLALFKIVKLLANSTDDCKTISNFIEAVKSFLK